MHNLAVAQINTMGLAEASDRFKEAYERSHNKSSLRQYFYALILTRQDERLKQEVMNYDASPDYLEQLKKELEVFYEEAEASEGYQVINNLKEQKENGRIVPFYDMAGELINRWKQEFRKENL
jgi:flagellar motility protein MotE (MotC chaperone)